MNIPIFFAFYLAGYLFCAKVLDLGIQAYSREFSGRSGWWLRRIWWWRITERYPRLIVAVLSFFWWWILGKTLVDWLIKKEDQSLDPSRLRHCTRIDKWCERQYDSKRCSHCAYDDRKITLGPCGSFVLFRYGVVPYCVFGAGKRLSRCEYSETDRGPCT